MSFLAKIYPHEPCPVLRMHGEPKECMKFVFMLATTKPGETDGDWWPVRVLTLFQMQNWRN